MKKKVSLKTGKKTNNKSISTQKIKNKNTSKISNMNKESIVVGKLRNFWELFSNVKNHNFNLMMRKGNYLDDFIRLVEELPEEQFQKIFIKSHDSKPIEVGCGCPKDTECLCDRKNIVKISNNYFDYLKENKLDKYEVEIQHLKYLIELQQKGTQVPRSYSLDEFLKRNDAPERSNKTNKYTGFVESSVKDEKLFEENLVKVKDESDKEVSTFVETLKKYINKNKEKEKHNVDSVLKALKDDEKSSNVVNNEDSSYNSELINSHLENFCEVKQEKFTDSSLLESALQTAVKYPEILQEDSHKTATAETSLPPFWQELKKARELFDKFDNFYAEKQVELVLAIRRMKYEKEKLLNTPEEHDYLTSLHQDTKRYLKAKRELKVLKTILKSAYQQFNQAEIVQVNPDSLKRELSYYASVNNKDNFEGIFDSLGPSKEAYEKAMQKRTAILRWRSVANIAKNCNSLSPSRIRRS